MNIRKISAVWHNLSGLKIGYLKYQVIDLCEQQSEMKSFESDFA